MPHNIHIDELILHDFDLSEAQGITFERALQNELTRLLGAGDLPFESFTTPGMAITLPSVAASPMAIGTQAAESVSSLISGRESAP